AKSHKAGDEENQVNRRNVQRSTSNVETSNFETLLISSDPWSQCAESLPLKLPMNRRCCGSQTRAPERASVRRSGSRSQCANQRLCRLPMNLFQKSLSL